MCVFVDKFAYKTSNLLISFNVFCPRLGAAALVLEIAPPLSLYCDDSQAGAAL